MVLEKIGFSPKKVFEKAFSLMRFKAESKGLRFTLSFSGEEISSVLLGDSHRINQVLINLMSNAIKFTHKGGVDIKIKVVVNDDNKQTLQISVADTGIGMEKEFSKQMFDMFSQEDSSVFRKFGGTGLGMSITKKLVNLMGGFISVDTEKGNGTTISFVLELEKGLMTSLETTEIIADYKQLLARKKVLMADDNEMNQLLAKTILSNVGIDVVVANNGVEALKNLKKDSFDLLLMDVHMPEMDGIEATRVIRHSVNKEIPIIALTAMAFKEDASLCLEAGMNDYLSKPFNENHLLAVVAKWTMKKEKGENLVEGIPVLDNGQAAKLYDLSRLREISKGDEAFMYKMIRLFITESTQGVNQMGLAYMKNDWAGIQKIAHRLKPSIENMGIYHLKDDMMELEMKAAVYQNNARMADLIAHVEKVISEVGLQLQQALGNEG
jgi:CheY-like chemotaxis protein/HPt (histidine-containing phosphotransfer) domain-containing protein